jgi:FkbM family methyltransferase
VVVEANPDMLPFLRENRDRNWCKFEISHGAAGADGKSIRLYLGNESLSSSAIAVAAKSVEVPGVRLTDLVESRNFERCALICDIEGAELNLIRSEMNTLCSRVEVIIMEFHPGINGVGAAEEAHRLLKDHGFAERWQERDVFVYENTALTGPPAGMARQR